METLLQTVPASERLALTESLTRVQHILSSAEHNRDQKSPARVIRATLSHAAHTRILLNEYYREVSVTQRDTPNTVHNFLTSPDSGFWIAYLGENPAGCVALKPLKRFRSAAECKRLYVRTQFRRRALPRPCSMPWRTTPEAPQCVGYTSIAKTILKSRSLSTAGEAIIHANATTTTRKPRSSFENPSSARGK